MTIPADSDALCHVPPPHPPGVCRPDLLACPSGLAEAAPPNLLTATIPGRWGHFYPHLCRIPHNGWIGGWLDNRCQRYEP